MTEHADVQSDVQNRKDCDQGRWVQYVLCTFEHCRSHFFPSERAYVAGKRQGVTLYGTYNQFDNEIK